MKTKKIFFALVVMTITTSMSFHILAETTLPPWAPANGYNAKTTHVFLPDQNIYFDLNKNVYIYEDNGQWFNSPVAPDKFRDVDLRNAKQIEIEMRNENPYTKNVEHREIYNKQVKAEQEAYLKEQKQKLEEAEKLQKEAERAQKENEKAQKVADKAQLESEKAQEKAQEAQKEMEKANEKAAQEVEKARLNAEKAQQKIDAANARALEQKDKAAQKAEKEAVKASLKVQLSSVMEWYIRNSFR